MNFIRDNQPIIVLSFIVVAMFIMAVALSPALRQGQEWAFAHHSVREVLSSLMKGK